MPLLSFFHNVTLYLDVGILVVVRPILIRFSVVVPHVLSPVGLVDVRLDVNIAIGWTYVALSKTHHPTRRGEKRVCLWVHDHIAAGFEQWLTDIVPVVVPMALVRQEPPRNGSVHVVLERVDGWGGLPVCIFAVRGRSLTSMENSLTTEHVDTKGFFDKPKRILPITAPPTQKRSSKSQKKSQLQSKPLT